MPSSLRFDIPAGRKIWWQQNETTVNHRMNGSSSIGYPHEWNMLHLYWGELRLAPLVSLGYLRG